MIENIILIPVILNLVNQPKETVKNENVIEIPIYKQEISISISRKQKNSYVSKKGKNLNYKVNVYKDPNYLHIKNFYTKKISKIQSNNKTATEKS